MMKYSSQKELYIENLNETPTQCSYWQCKLIKHIFEHLSYFFIVISKFAKEFSIVLHTMPQGWQQLPFKPLKVYLEIKV